MSRSEDLARRIRLGEDSGLELKRVALAGRRVTGPRRDDFADELAALANARGGLVVLGVDDATREVHGIPLGGLDAVERWIREVCNDSIEPADPWRSFEWMSRAACSCTRVRAGSSAGSAVRSARWRSRFWPGSSRNAVRAA